MNSKTPNTQSKKDVGAKVIEKVKQNDVKKQQIQMIQNKWN